jgi:hypothetical protein
MVREATRLDISAMPDLVRLAETVADTGRPYVLERDGEVVAKLVPTRGRGRRVRSTRRIDTSKLPPIPYRSLDELIADRDPPPSRAFTQEEIEEALERDRAEAWRSKYP